MIRDGIDQPRVARKLRRDGWMPIETAPLATPNIIDISAGIDILVDPTVVEIMTSSGAIVECFYNASGDYVDNWSKVSDGQKVCGIIGWRPIHGV